MYTIESFKIRKLNYTSGNLIAFAGGSNTNTIPADGSPASGNLKTPTTILSRNGTMYFSVSHSIMKVENGCFYRISGSWATCNYSSSYDGTASSACLSSPKLISVIDGKIYVYGGKGVSQAYSDLWCFDPETNIWTEIKPVSKVNPPALEQHTLVEHHGITGIQ